MCLVHVVRLQMPLQEVHAYLYINMSIDIYLGQNIHIFEGGILATVHSLSEECVMLLSHSSKLCT